MCRFDAVGIFHEHRVYEWSCDNNGEVGSGGGSGRTNLYGEEWMVEQRTDISGTYNADLVSDNALRLIVVNNLCYFTARLVSTIQGPGNCRPLHSHMACYTQVLHWTVEGGLTSLALCRSLINSGVV